MGSKPTKYKPVPFKVHRWYGSARAWCTAEGCHWTDRGQGTEVDHTAVNRVAAHAKKHTGDTGHETRIDTTYQRGFRVKQPRTPKAD